MWVKFGTTQISISMSLNSVKYVKDKIMLPFSEIEVKNPISEKKSAYCRNGFEIIIIVLRSAKYIKNMLQNKKNVRVQIENFSRQNCLVLNSKI